MVSMNPADIEDAAHGRITRINRAKKASVTTMSSSLMPALRLVLLRRLASRRFYSQGSGTTGLA